MNEVTRGDVERAAERNAPLDRVPHMVFTTDPAGRILSVNERWHQFTGTAPGARSALRWAPFVHPQDADMLRASWRRAARSGRPLEVTVRLRGALTRGYRWHLVRATAEQEESGAVRCWHGTTTDVHELLLRRDALEGRVEELEQADRRKDELLAVLAHELRNPVMALKAAARVLRGRDVLLEPTLARAVDVVNRQIARLGEVLSDSLEVARIARGKIELHPELVELGDLAQDVLEEVAPTLLEAGVALHPDLPTEATWLEVDRARIEQALVYLIEHLVAQGAAPSGGLELSMRPDGRELAVRVGWAGSQRSPTAPTIAPPGAPPCGWGRALDSGELAMGLHLARKLVVLHGGSLHPESSGAGRTSGWLLRLPATPRARQPRPRTAPVPRERPRLVQRRLLVVDDNRDAAELLAVLLEDLGAEVSLAYDGEQALEVARRIRPQVVVLDLGLPGLDGWEVARRLRAMPWDERPLLVALTGYGDRSARERAAEAGFDHHLLKGGDVESLLKVIEGS